ncbi:MAG: 1-(5-phosphoribosyl)-5-[(5-phosphoribosylamino)methylideneamino]imidazole-4-carboxamide isomerase [Anaeromicrobium sp.]|jgi:phosphoribosylformimino-5-aminoimidazole carboxamide ribotide isomerase|uniref:1-(5-phosphoribosyl)-5-[(5- phosphoribosylamino)methylideneamino]imidazole-4- carboxamide isomerase n=1 Tax=Anaeromicrobium sp. TaxID=1929132 RepID=UPI0025EA0F4E|nr:1-(5-phosphoribosyl)-5-[(5-phosphoribosylamino)methylideneamino]imidazole-4-carboxamide isomerase [Anaeromicrobium sp.]MCT4593892.1 1-(5-phosphoribosyl)-5-[(5-phosphoribosylamino)methylideneamino]imidazole-4-carboxamide isomerase [Anaeromicrobium sp.]
MIIFPAIDIKGGKCVRLYQGDFNKMEIVEDNPLRIAKEFEMLGAEFLHMVDLDGALKGESGNLEIMGNIVESINIPVQIGGGIRHMSKVERLMDMGVARVILGTSAIRDKEFLIKALEKYGNRVAVGIDAKDGYVAVDGWTDVSSINYIDFAKEMENIGVRTIIYTDISKDGTLKGPNVDGLVKLKENTNMHIVASGGISSLDDLKTLREKDFYGAIVGKAIYKGKVKLDEAIFINK